MSCGTRHSQYALPAELQEIDCHPLAYDRGGTIGLPKAGSADQLRQCIEGRLQIDREDPNVVAIVRQNSRGEMRLILADSEGEFLESSPARHEPTTPSPPRTSGDVGKISSELRSSWPVGISKPGS